MIPHMTYPQYRAVRRLVHSCCNHQDGNCLLLDDGEECVCPQAISYSLICRWFRAAVLPLDGELCAALLPRPLLGGGVAGSVNEFSPHPGTTLCTARIVPQNEPSGAKGIGPEKRGLVRRNLLTKVKTF